MCKGGENMYLKQLKAHGFKSFADKINIELSKGITGIVGPNGSGKSNVVDAVRWVLGEQSVKSLRGDGSMTDVIFAGSKSRRGMNVASVTLIFDNKDQYLPMPYEEVSIKRRVYQDGTNEYFLNGQKSRLKDITDLLLDSGIAKESFNIISQGKIEEIFSSKPAERRIIFEEAAGVLKYKRRKEEAFRKLNDTKSNMSRIDDIIQELSAQIEPLKEQKEKAEKYIDLKEKVANLELSIMTYDITKYHADYVSKKRQLEEKQDQFNQHQATHMKEDSEILLLKQQRGQLEAELKETRQNYQTCSAQASEIRLQKTLLQERKNYEVEDSKLHRELVQLKEKELQLLKNKTLNEQKEKQATLALEQLQMQLQEKRTICEQEKKKKQSLSMDLTDLVRQNNQLHLQIDALKERIENNGTLPFAVRQVLQNLKLVGIHDALGNLLEVESTYAQAISVALGFSAQAIVVENEMSAKEAIRFLKEKKIGRATFYPMSVMKPKNVSAQDIEKAKKIEGFIGIAAHLTCYDKQYDHIVLNQLGNVIVATHLDAANHLHKILEYRYKIVTLDGELLHVGGSLTGGSSTKNQTMIQDKYTLEKQLQESVQLEKQIQELENQVNEQDQSIFEQEQSYYQIQAQFMRKQEEARILKEQVAEAIKQLDDLQFEMKNIDQKQNNSLSSEEEKLMQESYSLTLQKEKLQLEITTLEQKLEGVSQTLEEREDKVKEDTHITQSLSLEIKKLEVELGRLDVLLDQLLETLNETYNMTYEKAATLYHLEQEEKKAKDLLKQWKQGLNALGTVNLGAIEEYDRVRERYEFLFQQREDLETATTTLVQMIEELDQVMEHDFLETFTCIQAHFKETFQELFRGGHAQLKLTDKEHLLTTGIEIEASPPGKKLSSISLLSGGEKTFTAISLLFAILKSRPVAFTILDEVEAALDEVNVDSFGAYLTKLKEKTQFILITHKKKTMEYADTLYGITMQESGVSKLVSVKLEDYV